MLQFYLNFKSYLLAVVLGLCFLGTTFHYSNKIQFYRNTDLIDKLVGSHQAVVGGYSPYENNLDSTHAHSDPFLCKNFPISRYTGTPAQSYLLYPITFFGYKTVKITWLVLSLLAYYLALTLLLKMPTHWLSYLAWIFGLMLPTTTPFEMHLERGQFYLMLLVFSALIIALKRNNLLVLLLVVLKPYFAPILLITSKNRLPIILVLLAISVSLTASQWIDWYTTTQVWANIQIGAFGVCESFTHSESKYAEALTISPSFRSVNLSLPALLYFVFGWTQNQLSTLLLAALLIIIPSFTFYKSNFNDKQLFILSLSYIPFVVAAPYYEYQILLPLVLQFTYMLKFDFKGKGALGLVNCGVLLALTSIEYPKLLLVLVLVGIVLIIAQNFQKLISLKMKVLSVRY